MVKKLMLGVLIAFASIGVAVAAPAGYEWWQERGDAASRIVAAPVDATTPATTTAASAPAEATTLEAEMDALRAEAAAVVAEAEALQAEAAAAITVEERASQQVQQPATTTTLHPQVQSQGMERVVAIIERHSDAWPWVVPAIDVAQLSFFEDLPSVCDSAIGCYSHTTGDIWLSLDALRERDPMSFSFFLDDHGPSDIVLHELAHAYTRSYPTGSDLLDLFGQHYAGCSSRGLETDRLVAELLADTMAMAATRAGSSLPNDYGYFRSGGFTGCLVESSQPDEALFGAVYGALFNCDSEHSLDVFENGRGRLRLRVVPDADAVAVLLTCYGIECWTVNRGCQNLTETDARRDAAYERLHERRCSDGLVGHAYRVFEEPGWEVGCEAFVPDDVECLVYRYRADEPDTPWRDDVNPGLLDVSGECIKPDCTVEGPQGEPQPGYREYSGFGNCIAIDRPEPENSDTDG